MPKTHYIWNPLSDSVLMETDENHATTAVYTVEPVPFGKVIAQKRGNTKSYYHYDGLGSTRQLTDSTGAVTDTNLYDAWGVNVDSTGTTENPFRWVGEPGYYWDAELERYYVRARTYEPASARWTSRDPFGGVESLFLPYLYGSASPIIQTDPSGAVDIGTEMALAEAVRCKGLCGGRRLGVVHATPMFLHRSRRESPTNFANANGMGIAIYFYADPNVCRCSSFEFIQALTVSHDGNKFTYIDACGPTPYYGQNPGGTTPDYGEHRVPPGYPDWWSGTRRAPRWSTISLYDRPYRENIWGVVEDTLLAQGIKESPEMLTIPGPRPFAITVSLEFTSCVVCVGAYLLDHILEPCVRWGYTYTYDSPVRGRDRFTRLDEIGPMATDSTPLDAPLRALLWGSNIPLAHPLAQHCEAPDLLYGHVSCR